MVWVAFAVGVIVGGVVVRWRWPRTVMHNVSVPAALLPWQERRFNVVLSTNNGAEARTLYEQVKPRDGSDGVIQFFDDYVPRGEKRGAPKGASHARDVDSGATPVRSLLDSQ